MKIVSRATWGARYDNGAGPAPLPASEGVAVHHSVTPARNGYEAVRLLEQIGESRFGKGISYTFPITPDGTVYEGHSVDRLGAHTGGHNSTVRAICFIGDYSTVSPTAAQIEAAAQLVAHGVRQGWWPLRVRGHRDFKATGCPGDRAYAAIPSIVARAQAILNPPTKRGLFMHLSESEEREILSIARKLNKDYLTSGSGVRQVIATINSRLERVLKRLAA